MNPTEAYAHLLDMVKLTSKLGNEFFALEDAYEKAKAAFCQQQDAHDKIYKICYPLNPGDLTGTFRDRNTHDIVGWVICGKWESAGVRELNEFEMAQVQRFIKSRE